MVPVRAAQAIDWPGCTRLLAQRIDQVTSARCNDFHARSPNRRVSQTTSIEFEVDLASHRLDSRWLPRLVDAWVPRDCTLADGGGMKWGWGQLFNCPAVAEDPLGFRQSERAHPAEPVAQLPLDRCRSRTKTGFLANDQLHAATHSRTRYHSRPGLLDPLVSNGITDSQVVNVDSSGTAEREHSNSWTRELTTAPSCL